MGNKAFHAMASFVTSLFENPLIFSISPTFFFSKENGKTEIEMRLRGHDEGMEILLWRDQHTQYIHRTPTTWLPTTAHTDGSDDYHIMPHSTDTIET